MQVVKEQPGAKALTNQSEDSSRGTPSSQSAQGKTAGGQLEVSSRNNLPLVDSAALQTESLNTGERIRVIAKGGDKDSDSLTFTYAWTKNGEPAGEGDSITGFKKGDKLSVKITPYDGKEYGQAKTLTTVINNTPPKIMEHKQITFDGKTYTYQVKAFDPDGDTLIYTLKEAPLGMVINRSTGLITWKVDEKTSGKFPASVQVSDGQGGETVYSFEVSISPENAQR
jgi:hypothetical protein